MTESKLVPRVAPDPDLKGKEKETTITMYGDGKSYTIYSAKPTIIKSLLKHDYFELDWARVMSNGTSTTFETMEELEESIGDIVAIQGTLPVGTLTVKSKPRTKNHQSQIINTETIDPSVFGDS